MRRRDFITFLGGLATAWPVASLAQQPPRVRRIGVLILYPNDDPEAHQRTTAFRQGLERLGWAIGINVQIDIHWGVGDAEWIRAAATELLRLGPDVILANGDAAARVTQRLTRTVPIIFIAGSDPVADGLVQSLARPGGNITGFSVLEPSLGPKLLELLKEAAPRVRHVAMVFNPDNGGNRQLVENAVTAGPRFAVEVVAVPVPLDGSKDIEALMMQWERETDYGLIVPPDPATNSRRRLLVQLAARYRLPAIHALRAATSEGGLMSYGVDIADLFRLAAGYADRILKGESPADLPVQLPTKFDLAINLKTAKALGLSVPPSLLARADEVIE